MKPKAYSATKVAITEIGSASPVMIVLRQEPRNRKTISTVRRPPSMMVCFTLSAERCTKSDVARSSRSSAPAGSCFLTSSAARFRFSPTSTILASCALKT